MVVANSTNLKSHALSASHVRHTLRMTNSSVADVLRSSVPARWKLRQSPNKNLPNHRQSAEPSDRTTVLCVYVSDQNPLRLKPQPPKLQKSLSRALQLLVQWPSPQLRSNPQRPKMRQQLQLDRKSVVEGKSVDI